MPSPIAACVMENRNLNIHLIPPDARCPIQNGSFEFNAGVVIQGIWSQHHQMPPRSIRTRLDAPPEFTANHGRLPGKTLIHPVNQVIEQAIYPIKQAAQVLPC